MRLNKFISESGLCSRREADRFIEQGTVFINGKRASIGDRVEIGDKVKVNGNELEPNTGEEIIFIALNKPVGITSTTEEDVRDNIIQFVNHSKRVFPIGRLDKDSQGLIFLTNNGDMVNKILRAGNKHEKEYVVTVNKPLTDAVLQSMANGVSILGVNTRKCKITQEGANTFRIVLVQGLNRQIRRMCEHFGYDVIKLERVRIMNISLKGLPVGDWRDLTEQEMKIIYSMIANSDSEVRNNSGIQKQKNIPSSESKIAGTAKNNKTINKKFSRDHTIKKTSNSHQSSGHKKRNAADGSKNKSGGRRSGRR